MHTAADPDAALKRVAIVQSCYIPWKGYFDLINQVDEFILYDDRQFTRRDWRNRNIVKTAHGPIWLTIPVQKKGRYHQRIDETLVQGSGWRETHWRTIAHAYARAPHFDRYAERFAPLYLESAEERLSAINRAFLEAVCDELGIETPLTWSTDYDAEGDRTERLVSLCMAAGAAEYVSGPSARDYLDEELFAREGIAVTYVDYDDYPEYPQLHPPFEHAVSVFDLLLNVGPDARRYMKTFPESEVRVCVTGA